MVRFSIKVAFFLTVMIFLWFTQTFAQSLVDLEGVPICASNGGVDCSITHPEAFVVCKDGTVDKSFIIYTVPQCREELKVKTRDESAFLTQSGCFPPSEIGCINLESYKNLSKVLEDSEFVGSELGRIHLSLCLSEISLFNELNLEYKQCLVKNGRPDFTLSGRETLPLLKSIFCPAFYGDNSYYNFNADLCLCNEGYYMSSGGKCVGGDQVCSIKYGDNSYTKGSNCYCEAGYRLDESNSICVLENKSKKLTSPFPLDLKDSRQNISTDLIDTVSNDFVKVDLDDVFTPTNPGPKLNARNVLKPSQNKSPRESNFIKRFFDKIIDIFVNILK
jgi:hypothetical protein